MNNIYSCVTDQIQKLKPVIRRIIPQKARHSLKKIALRKTEKEMASVEILPYISEKYETGINLIGPKNSPTGLGQSMRLLEQELRHTSTPIAVIDIAKKEDMQSDKLSYGINIWHVNASEFPDVYIKLGRGAFDDHYNIAFWLWELEEFPDEWVPYLNLLDEVWTPSEFISRSIRKITDKPVYTIPYAVSAKTDTKRYNRAFFHLPEDKFLYLMMYDALSIRERKNPDGVIQAFKKAFLPEEKDVGLVIKVTSADQRELNYLRKQFEAYDNIYIMNTRFEKEQVNSLIACVDVLVSLHRAEGFGLVLAEAMLNETPVIATNWSANTEFMNPEVACMVNYQLETLKQDTYPYKKGNHWAVADLDDASAYMRRLKQDWNYYAKIQNAAKNHISKVLSMEAVSALLSDRLEYIYHE